MNTEDKLLATLKRHTPAKVRAYASDDDHRDIAVPGKRKRWTQVVAAVQAKAWVKVELLDKSGSVLAYVDNDEPAGDLENLGEGKMVEGHQLLNLLIKAQEMVLRNRDKETSAILQGFGDIVRAQNAAMAVLTNLYQQQVEAASDVAEMRAEAEHAGDGDTIKQLIEAAPQLLPMIPMLKSIVKPT